VGHFLTFFSLGFSNGAIYVGIAAGLVSIYFSSGVLNFAQAAIAMWGAYVYATLRTSGRYVFPVGSVQVGSSVGSLPAVVIAVVTAVVLGALVHLLVFRPLRRASAVAQIVASVAVLIAIIGLTEVRFGATGMQAPQMLPTGVLHFAGARFNESDLILLGASLLFCALVAAYFRWTTAGIATRAAANNEDALELMGYNPHLLDAGAWAIASVGSTALLILASPATSLNLNVAYFVVPGLAVLLVARMRSLLLVAVAGVLLGVSQSLLTLGSSYTWWPSWARSGLQDGLPFLVAVVVLFALGNRLGVRDIGFGSGLPRVRAVQRPVVALAVVAVVAVVGLLVTSGPTRFGVITSIIMAVLVLSYTLLTGYLGEISLAQMAFAGAAGFLLSKLTESWGIGFPLSLLLAAMFATAIGIIIGVAALRFRGAQLAIVTIAAAVAVQSFVFNNAYFTSLTGNPVGEPRIFGINLAIEGSGNVARLPFGILAVALLLLCSWAIIRWGRGRTGRAWLAIRSNERAAAAAGIDVARAKIGAFAISAFIAGIAGCLVAYSQGQLSTGSFQVETGILIFATAFLGGITGLAGALVAGAIAPLGVLYVVLNNHISFGKYYDLVAGLGLIVTILANPEGIAGRLGEQLRSLVRRFGRARAPDGDHGGSRPPVGGRVVEPAEKVAG
jgi:branched-chain amino acid transport system permease protein